MKNYAFEVVKVGCAVCLFVMLVCLFSGCAGTADGLGSLLKGVGNAAASIGDGTGKLLNGMGDDLKDASSKQISNKNRQQQYVIEDTTKTQQ